MARKDMKELLSWIKPLYPPDEIEWAKELSTVDVTVYGERLYNMGLEAKEIFQRVGQSFLLRSGDFSVGIHTAMGELASGWTGTWMHTVIASIPPRYIMEAWKDDPTVGIKDGDIFYNNDPLYGAMHFLDQQALIPVFNEGELIAWTTATVHTPENGAHEPGGLLMKGLTRWDEGMKIACLKIGENFQIRSDILELFECGVRNPAGVVSDVKARATVCDLLRVRLVEISKERGNKFVRALLRRLMLDAEAGARKRISSANDGKYRAVTFHDLCGPGPEFGLVRASLTVDKRGDHMTFDITGTSQENMGPFQCMAAGTAAMLCCPMLNFMFSDLPLSLGIFAPIDFVFPEEPTFLSPRFDGCTANAPIVGNTMLAVGNMALSTMMFDSDRRECAVAPANLCTSFPCLVGPTQWRDYWIDLLLSVSGGGLGGRPGLDGMDISATNMVVYGRMSELEDEDLYMPITTLFRKLRRDGCGHGKYRGGANMAHAFAISYVPFNTVLGASMGGNYYWMGMGLFGGYPPPLTPMILITDCNVIEMMKRGEKVPMDLDEILSKEAFPGARYHNFGTHVPPTMLKEGEIFVFTGGTAGSGYGDVLEREPELAMKDLRNGIVSHWTVQNVYHIAYDPERLIPDYEKTKELREKERQARLARGKTYEEFEKDWLNKRPPAEFLEWYGSWPDAKPQRSVMRL